VPDPWETPRGRTKFREKNLAFLQIFSPNNQNLLFSTPLQTEIITNKGQKKPKKMTTVNGIKNIIFVAKLVLILIKFKSSSQVFSTKHFCRFLTFRDFEFRTSLLALSINFDLSHNYSLSHTAADHPWSTRSLPFFIGNDLQPLAQAHVHE